jgi:hypothetical protein
MAAGVTVGTACVARMCEQKNDTSASAGGGGIQVPPAGLLPQWREAEAGHSVRRCGIGTARMQRGSLIRTLLSNLNFHPLVSPLLYLFHDGRQFFAFRCQFVFNADGRRRIHVPLDDALGLQLL